MILLGHIFGGETMARIILITILLVFGGLQVSFAADASPSAIKHLISRVLHPHKAKLRMTPRHRDKAADSCLYDRCDPDDDDACDCDDASYCDCDSAECQCR